MKRWPAPSLTARRSVLAGDPVDPRPAKTWQRPDCRDRASWFGVAARRERRAAVLRVLAPRRAKFFGALVAAGRVLTSARWSAASMPGTAFGGYSGRELSGASSENALQNAASVASLMLTTECVLAERPKKRRPAAPGAMRGRGHGDV
jgi:hypothetical protein